jgi:hypothetical protein
VYRITLYIDFIVCASLMDRTKQNLTYAARATLILGRLTSHRVGLDRQAKGFKGKSQKRVWVSGERSHEDARFCWYTNLASFLGGQHPRSPMARFARVGWLGQSICRCLPREASNGKQVGCLGDAPDPPARAFVSVHTLACLSSAKNRGTGLRSKRAIDINQGFLGGDPPDPLGSRRSGLRMSSCLRGPSGLRMASLLGAQSPQTGVLTTVS